MSTLSVPRPAERESILIVYGDPPSASLEDSAGRPIGKALTISSRNQGSFEIALRRAMSNYSEPTFTLRTPVWSASPAPVRSDAIPRVGKVWSSSRLPKKHRERTP